MDGIDLDRQCLCFRIDLAAGLERGKLWQLGKQVGRRVLWILEDNIALSQVTEGMGGGKTVEGVCVDLVPDHRGETEERARMSCSNAP